MNHSVLRAEPMSSSHMAKGCYVASAWTIFWVDGVMLDHPVPGGHYGFATVLFDRAPIQSGDPVAWAKKEALRIARSRDAKRVAYIANRFRRRRLLVTHDENHEYFRFAQSEFFRRKRPLMSPDGYEQKGLNHNQMDMLVTATREDRGPIPRLKEWVRQQREQKGKRVPANPLRDCPPISMLPPNKRDNCQEVSDDE